MKSGPINEMFNFKAQRSYLNAAAFYIFHITILACISIFLIGGCGITLATGGLVFSELLNLLGFKDSSIKVCAQFRESIVLWLLSAAVSLKILSDKGIINRDKPQVNRLIVIPVIAAVAGGYIVGTLISAYYSLLPTVSADGDKGK